MRKLTLIAGLPRAGSTLLCQILNSKSNHHVTPTSGTIDMLRNVRSTFSANPTFRAQNRLEIYGDMRNALNGCLNGFYQNYDMVFDKCRGWMNNINFLDDILGHNETKIIWCYRDPVEVVSSIEARYQQTILLENMDESAAPGAFATLERRIATYINNESIITYPVEILKDAIEMGHLSRIMFVKYYDLTNNTQNVMDEIHKFIGEDYFEYDLKNVKQTTWEFDGIYNYKFMHQIKEGEIAFKKADVTLPEKYIQIINERFFALNKLMFDGDPTPLLGIKIEPTEESLDQKSNEIIAKLGADENEEHLATPSTNPFKVN
jgi:sulfotransferase